MDVALKSDDFASLLAALGRTSGNTLPQSVSAQQFVPPQQPVMWNTPQMQAVAPAAIAAPPPAAVVVTTVPSSMGYIITIIILCLIIVAVAVVAWMRGAKMKEEASDDEDEEEEEEEEYNVVKDTVRELPPPSSIAFNNQIKSRPNLEEEEAYVATNILKYAKNQNYVDLSGFELPAEENFNKYSTAGRKIVADESTEVLEYAKRREALFDN